MSNHAAKRQAARAALAILCERWPLCFKLDDRKPLKVGIFADIVAALGDGAAPPRHVIGAALRAYTQPPAYLGSMVIGAARIDLDGTPAGIVTEAEAVDAKARLEAQTMKAKQAKTVRKEVVAPPATSTQPKRDGFEALRAAARARRARQQAGQ